MYKKKTLAELIRYYQCDNKQEFFDEMSKCLQVHFIIDKSNYKDYLPEFEKSYDGWVNSFK